MGKKDECDCEFPQTLEEGSHLGLMNALANCPHIGKPESHKQELEALVDKLRVGTGLGAWKANALQAIETNTANKIQAELQSIADVAYDDMHQTYDYNRLAEALFDRLKAQQDTSKGELDGNV